MKIKALVILVVLACLSPLSLLLSPVVEAVTIARLEPPAGEVGKLVQLVGSISCGSAYQIYWGSVKEENLLTQGRASGCAYVIAQFKVPETYKGRHRVILVDAKTGDEASYNFTVIPAITASASKGAVATQVAISGSGFEANETDIKIIYDGAVVKDGITSNIKGSWSTTIEIPQSSKGEHSIQASGALTTANEVGYVPFTVTPKISLEPSAGGVGATVTVVGTGFGAAEKDIKITFDGVPVKTGIVADSHGSFRTTFTVPKADKKDYIVDAVGSGTTVTEVPNVIFTLGTTIVLQPAAGYVGDKVTVFGSGFAANEADIKVIYDNTEVCSGITADASGAWVAAFTIPPGTAGSHPVTASGATTDAEEVKNQSFRLLPRLTVSPISGGVGTRIVITGTGFGKSQPVAISYDDTELPLDMTTDTEGSFMANFDAPASPGEQHQVSVKDSAGNRAIATFFTETTPPPTPSPLSPPPESRVGLIGRQSVTFQWSEVTDPSGVSYILEISRQADFKSPILRHKDLIKTEYTLSEAEALDHGNYYWRVKAVDGAGNDSAWTEAQPFTVSRLRLSTFLIIVGSAALALILVLWRIIPITLKLVLLVPAVALYLPLSPPAQAAYITSLEPARGTVGQRVILKGGVTCGNSYQIYWDSVAPANLMAHGKSEAGCTIVAELIIPEAAKGKHRLILRDVELGTEAGHDFTIVPAITASPLSGTTGTAITITGTGFGANETEIKITYDGATVKGGIAADAKGRWNATFNIPESSRGEHAVQTSGAETTAEEVSSLLFTVTPKFSVEPISGGSGVTVTAAGTGFGAAEKDIKITFDGIPVKTGVSADSHGSFRTTFTVPTAIKGEHTIGASGTITKATEVTSVIFTVGPSLLIQPTAGHVGDKVTVLGSGFAANEADIRVTYDDSEVASGITADANGAWVATFTTPPSSAGSHPVSAAGATTPPQAITSPAFIIFPQLALNPTSGEVGTRIVITGSGFGKSQPLTISYDDIKLALDVATDPEGSFTATFKVPAAFGERHEVSVKDNAGNRAVASFTTETIPPPVPAPSLPPPDTTIGFVGKQIVTFQWSEVTDPSGVSYILEISRQADFTSPILRHKDLIKTEYTLSEAEALDYGNYYWRVKAVDGAGNESDWTEAQPFTVNRLKTNVFLIIIGIAAFFLILTVWRIITITRRGGWFEEY